MSDITILTPDLFVHAGAINVGILRQGANAWPIDRGDGDVLPTLQTLGIRQVEAVLFTHYHRDQASGFGQLPGAPAIRAVVPASERLSFAEVERFWSDPAFRWHLYDFQPSDLLLGESIRVETTVQDGDRLDFGPWTIRVLATPGHTPGSVTYLIESGGRGFAFSGDLIAGPGQVWDVYSLQRGGRFGDRTIRDYHGFLGARSEVVESVSKLRNRQTSVLVPSHGVLMADPSAAIGQLIAYHFPGQTYYHGAMLVEGHGQRLFFIGDSFTMAGLDDYCAGNRNLLGPGRGFDACLALVEDLQPDLLFNCHVNVAFSFTADELRCKRRNLVEREANFGALLPWDEPNFGLDEHWVRVEPYQQQARPGQTIALDVVITNHAESSRPVGCQPIVPVGWETVPSVRAVVPGRAEGTLRFGIRVPKRAEPGTRVVPIDVEFAGRRLGQFRQAVLTVGSHSGERGG